MKYVVSTDESALVAIEASIQSAFGFYVTSGCRYTAVFKNLDTGVCMIPVDAFLEANYTFTGYTLEPDFPETDFGPETNIVLL